MADRFARIFTKTGNVNYFDDLVKQYESGGIFLVRPHLNHIILWNGGEPRMDLAYDELFKISKSGKDFTFAWWLDEEYDIVCGIGIEAGTNYRCEDYDLTVYRLRRDMLPNEIRKDMQPIIEALLNGFKMRIKTNESVGLVVDATGMVADYPWHELLIGDAILEPDDKRLWGAMPTVLGIHESKLKQIKVDFSHFKKETIGEFIIFSNY